jgi:hypothetical protein
VCLRVCTSMRHLCVYQPTHSPEPAFARGVLSLSAASPPQIWAPVSVAAAAAAPLILRSEHEPTRWPVSNFLPWEFARAHKNGNRPVSRGSDIIFKGGMTSSKRSRKGNNYKEWCLWEAGRD